MALLNRLSIKWKLSLAIILAGLTLILAYVLITNRVFKSDKIAYVFDSQSSWIESVTSNVESKFNSIFLNARVITSTFDFETGRPSAIGDQIFKEDQAIIAVELWNDDKNESMVRLEKQASLLPPIDGPERVQEPDVISYRPLNEKMGLLSLRFQPSDRGNLRLRTVVNISAVFPKPSLTQSMALAHENKIISTFDLKEIDPRVFEALARDGRETSTNRTHMFRFGTQTYLVSEHKLSVGNLRLIGLTSESEALGALASLRNRLVLFLLFSIFGLILISLLLSRGLTQNLGLLTQHATEIGQGNFDSSPSIASDDEIGVLSRAFTTMSSEIKRLLTEMRDKTRMEEELKTARLIQERLLPPKESVTVGEIEISGLVMTSSETGGDWWHYFERGDDVYVAIADATGHGTPAALITAAARSIFSRLEKENLSLKEMMQAWDAAVASCSSKQVFMTGILFRFNSKTGEGAFYNAAHDAPFVFRASQFGNFEWESLATPASPQLGDGMDPQGKEVPFSLQPNDCLLLYTDGLFSVTRDDGGVLSERRVGNFVASRPEAHQSAKNVTLTVLKAFSDHRKDLPMPDDVSLVAVRRTGPPRAV